MNLQFYKENVSIIQMVEALGYAYNRQKGRSPKQYEHPNGDKVIINDKLYPKVEVYFTRNNYEDKGTVVDFVKNRLPMFNVRYQTEWEGELKVLSEFAGQQHAPSKLKPLPEKPSKPFQPNDFEIRQATNSYYTNADGETVQKTTWHDCKKFVRTVNEKFLEKLTKGATVTILGTLSYDEYDKEVTKTKSVKIKKAYIDVVAMEIL